ncbi:MAG TPA: DUF5320 domain-containing protein [Bacteroidales bacterium]|nr:DUF5320 domain-containing protein [Bacteroidales bacterium]
MPQLNGKGPESKGPKTGRGLGLCKKELKEEDLAKLGKGQGKRRKSGGGTGKGKRLQSGSIK